MKKQRKLRDVHRVTRGGNTYKYFRGNRIPLPSDVPETSIEFIKAYRRARQMTKEEIKAVQEAKRRQTGRYLACRKMVSRCRRRSIEKGWNFILTADDFEAIAIKQNLKCAVSGLPLEFSPRGPRDPYAASPDRIDCSRGYEPDNVRLVCSLVNYALNSFGDETLQRFATAIHRERHKRGKP